MLVAECCLLPNLPAHPPTPTHPNQQVQFSWQPGSFVGNVTYTFTAYFVNGNTDQRSGPSATVALCTGSCS